MNKIKSILLLATVLILLVGIANATDVSDDTIGEDSPERMIIDTPAQEEVAVQEKNTPTMDVQEKTVKQKSNIITKEEKNIKTATEYNVENYQQLQEALISSDNSITVNIKNNITLEVRLSIKPTYVTINGEANTINGANQCQFLYIKAGKTVTINNLTITKCYNPLSGGAIENYGNLTVVNTNFTKNNGGTYAGVIYNENGILTVNNTQFNNNEIFNLGGVIYNYNGTLTIDNSEFTNSKANNNAGVIFNENGILAVTNTNFTNNVVTGSNMASDSGGGAIYNHHGILTMNNTQFTNNNATMYHGGAIYNHHGILTMNNTQFTGNNANNHGGAIHNEYGTLTLTNTQFANNNARSGGAIYNKEGILTVTDAEFANNVGNDYGGAICNNDGTVKEITNTIFFYNTNWIKGYYIQSNFIINESNNINLKDNDTFITVGSFTVMVDGEEKFHGSGNEQLNEYVIPSDNYDVTLLLNGTDSKTRNNTFIIRSLKEKTVHNYPELMDAMRDVRFNEYSRYTINLEEGDYNATGSIILNSLTATTNITINGNGVTLDGNNRTQFISNGNNLTLENIIIKNYTASDGGAIKNNGTLTIKNSTLTDNTATYKNENGCGGAIYNWLGGTLNITNSTFNNNTATGENYAQGGAIYNYDSTIFITNSTFNNNTATGENYGYGGVIYTYGGNLNIINSTLTYNTASEGSAIYNYYRETSIKITDSTFDMNSPINYKINDENHIQLINNDEYIPWGATYAIYLDDEAECVYTESLNSYTVPKYHTIRLVVNGSDTSTFGNNTFIVYPYDKIVRNYTQLVEAVEDAKRSYEEEYYIYLLPGDYNATDDMTWESAFYTHQLFIDGNGLTLNGNKMHQFMKVDEDYNLTLYNITLSNYTATRGGAIYNNGTLNITNSNLTYNTVTGENNGYGGAIYNNDGTLSITGSNLTHNNVTGENIGCGGAIYNINGTLNMTNSNIIDNNVTGQYNGLGGAIYNNGGTLNITGSNLTHNNVTGYNNGCGGAIYNYDGTLSITDSNLTHNNVTGQKYYGYGGAIYNNNATLNITDSNFTHNIATGQYYGVGGAIYNIYGTATIYKNIFTNNLAKSTTANEAIIDEGQDTVIKDNINADSSKYSSTIYTKNNYDSTVKPVNITFNTFDDKPRNTSIIISTDNTTTPIVTDKINITLELKDEFDLPVAGENITVIINQNRTTLTTDSTGMTSMIYKLMSNETFINATYHGKKGDYNSTSTMLTLTCEKMETKLLVDDISTAVAKEFTINGTLLDINDKAVVDAIVNITVNGSTSTVKTNTQGKFNTTMTIQQMGEYPINVTFYENNGYKESNNNTARITAFKTDTKLSIKVSNTTPINNTSINITATLTDTNGNKLANQNIIITVGSKTYTVKTNINGTAIQAYTPIKVEKQTITVKYNGNNQYINSSATSSITVKKINTKLTVKVSNTTPINNTEVNITATLTDANGNKLSGENITFTVAGKTYTAKTNANGIAIKTYKPTTMGKQTITSIYNGNSKYNNTTATTNITVQKINTRIELKVSNTTPINSTPINITSTLTDVNGNKLTGQNIILNINGKNYTIKTDSNGSVTKAYTPSTVESQTITATYTGNSMYNNSTTSTKITVKNKINTKTTVSLVKGVIGEKLTLKATVVDNDNKKVNEGNLIFKLNGITIKDNGKLSGSSNPLKVKVINGVATTTIIPDIAMRNAAKLTASYIGTSIYNKSTSNTAKIQVSQRNASIIVSSNVKTIKQGQVLTITAKIYDTTNGKKSTNLVKYADEFVYFKVNGITLKDAKGNMIKVKVVNGVATINYTIPLGLSGVTDGKTMTPKNHTILAGFYNKNYQENIRNTSTFQVERSNITITITNATVKNKTHKLSLTATIKDYLGNIVLGPNKCVIKINGISLKNGTNSMYYYSTNGILQIKDINIPIYKNYKTIEIVTQDRLSYKSQRNTTSIIKVIN